MGLKVMEGVILLFLGMMITAIRHLLKIDFLLWKNRKGK